MPVIPIAASAALAYGLYSAGKSSGTQTLSLNVPEATPQERRAAALSEAAQRAGIQSAGYDIKENPDGTIELVQKPLTEDEVISQKLSRAVNQQMLDYIEGKTTIPEGRRKLVEEAFAPQVKFGKEDITRTLRDIMATRGLALETDTPAREELLRQITRFEETMAGAKAGTLLSGESAERASTEAVRQFQEGLKQQDFLAKITAAQLPTQTSLGLAGLRYGSSDRTGRTYTSPLDMLMKGAGAAGGLLTGMGGMGLRLA